MQLLTDSNTKIKKGEKLNWKTYILNFLPGDLSGHEVCSHRTKECFKYCLNTAGHGNLPSVVEARMRRTKMFFADEDHYTFMNLLYAELTVLNEWAKLKGQNLAIRLNGTSDIEWEKIRVDQWHNQGAACNIFSLFPEIRFYDYSKIPIPKRQPPKGFIPYFNYHLTFSWNGYNKKQCLAHLDAGYNVAVPYTGSMPMMWRGWPTINGDINDLRFLDETPRVVMLRAKGKLRGKTSPFAVNGG